MWYRSLTGTCREEDRRGRGKTGEEGEGKNEEAERGGLGRKEEGKTERMKGYFLKFRNFLGAKPQDFFSNTGIF